VHLLDIIILNLTYGYILGLFHVSLLIVIDTVVDHCNGVRGMSTVQNTKFEKAAAAKFEFCTDLLLSWLTGLKT
jgi:hypothetical protein